MPARLISPIVLMAVLMVFSFAGVAVADGMCVMGLGTDTRGAVCTTSLTFLACEESSALLCSSA